VCYQRLWSRRYSRRTRADKDRCSKDVPFSYENLIDRRRRRRHVMNIERPFSRDISIDVDLNDVRSGPTETHIGEECDIVGIAVGFDDKFRWYRNNDFFTIWCQHFHLRFELAVAYPMIDDCKLQ